MSLKPKYQIGQKLVYIEPYFYNGNFESVSCYPVTIQAITIYENCIKYVDNEYSEIDEADLVPYVDTSIGQRVINEIERNIDTCKQ